VQWGIKDHSLLCPLIGQTLENFDQALYNLMYHMNQQRSEILSWPSSVRLDVWKRHMKQRDLEKEEIDKSRR
jgi:hypothetical protein